MTFKDINELKTMISEVNTLTDASGYVMLVSNTAVSWVYIFSMFFLTADRLLASTLSVRYKSLSTVHRTKVIIISSWALVVLAPVAAISGVYYSYEEAERLAWW